VSSPPLPTHTHVWDPGRRNLSLIWPQPVLRVDCVVQDPVPNRSWEDYSFGWVAWRVIAVPCGDPKDGAKRVIRCILRRSPLTSSRQTLCLSPAPVVHFIVSTRGLWQQPFHSTHIIQPSHPSGSIVESKSANSSKSANLLGKKRQGERDRGRDGERERRRGRGTEGRRDGGTEGRRERERERERASVHPDDSVYSISSHEIPATGLENTYLHTTPTIQPAGSPLG
jgi:hypothetical protein